MSSTESSPPIMPPEGLRSPVLSKIVFDKSLTQDDVPYSISFNCELFTQLLISIYPTFASAGINAPSYAFKTALHYFISKPK